MAQRTEALLEWARRERKRMAQQNTTDSACAARRESLSEDDLYEKGDTCQFTWSCTDVGCPVTLAFSLLSQRKLFAARLWPAAALIAEELGAIPALVENKCVLEIGAGAALPSVCAALARAHAVLVTDYPDSRMLDNIRANITRNLGHAQQQGVRVVGYDWSQCPERLLTELSHLLEEVKDSHGNGTSISSQFNICAAHPLICLCSTGQGTYWTFAGPATLPPAAVSTAVKSVNAHSDHSGDLKRMDATMSRPFPACQPGVLQRFDVILMSDLLYELDHERLLLVADTCLALDPAAQVATILIMLFALTLERAPTQLSRPVGSIERAWAHLTAACLASQVLLSFQPHDAVHLRKQLAFFDLARSSRFRFSVHKLRTVPAPKMFPCTCCGTTDCENVSQCDVSRQAHLYRLTRAGCS
mmetsp:Transcript_55424/g.120760  ORF Transcript_55424/g.120760 Transcript_55424/m.120760 type:complete len:416 (-) Transcript_55424:138-1385(-)